MIITNSINKQNIKKISKIKYNKLIDLIKKIINIDKNNKSIK